MTLNPRALAERHRVRLTEYIAPFVRERRIDHRRVPDLVEAVEAILGAYDALARYALDREAAIARFVRAERLSDAARDLYEDWTSRHDPGSDYRSAGQDRLCNALAGLAMWADDEYDAARAALTLAPPRGAATGDDDAVS